MEITEANFWERLPEIKDAIDKATFLSINCKLTGCFNQSEINAYDTPEQYFQKVRNVSKDFSIIQFGLCIFRYTPRCTFKQKTYNFYIFPRHFKQAHNDQKFLSQASSIHYLTSNGFDFNKLYEKGIPFLNAQQETKYQAFLIRKNMRATSEEHKLFIETITKEIDDFIDSDRQEHTFQKCNSFYRKLIYETAKGSRIDKRFSLDLKQLDTNERVLVLTRLQGKVDPKHDEQLKESEEDEVLQQAKGFSNLMNYISSSRKLIVGYNMMLDVYHSIDKFITSVPEDYKSFKECVNYHFPKILDIKHMSRSFTNAEESAVSELLQITSEAPFSLPTIGAEAGRNSYIADLSNKHEAGYEALSAGVCFLAMWKYLGDLQSGQNMNFDVIKDYMNRIYLMRVQDVPYIQLDGPDPKPSRQNILFISFPETWTQADILKLVSPLVNLGKFKIAWIDTSSAYIAVPKGANVAEVLSKIPQSDDYKIMTYHQRQAELDSVLRGDEETTDRHVSNHYDIGLM